MLQRTWLHEARRIAPYKFDAPLKSGVDRSAYFVKYASTIPTMPPSHQPTLWRTCRVLANRKRLQMLALLIRQPNQTVSTVAHQMRLSLPAASQYLRALEGRGLLTCRRVGLQVGYRPAVT